MIWESSHWKEPLLKSATWLRKIRFGENTQERTYVKIEKELFIGFYSIRKLLETVKITDATKNKKYEIEWYKNTEKVNHLNWHKIDKLYNLNKKNKECRDIGFICNLIIHSYVFIISGDDTFSGVYVSSDSMKNKKLYFISIENILSIFRLVGRDYPSSSAFIKNSETGEYEGSVW
jgi:hypothetical protein